MTYLFYAIAAAMTLLALGLVLLPMLRRGRREGRPRGVFALALGVAFVLPLAVVGLYALVGTPAALDPAARQPPKLSVQQALAQLRQHLAAQPDDLRGWLLLAQSDAALQHPADARDDYEHALKLAPDNADIMVAWVEADSLAGNDHRIDGKARDLLQKAVRIDPRNQRGLWLLGISDYQLERFVDAALTWRRLLVLLDPGGKVAQAVQHQIDMANARAGGKTQAQAEALLASAPARAGSTAAPAPASAAETPRLQVHVSLAPSLRGHVATGSTLFVFARDPHGPPMPLAVTRLDASKLPVTVTLTDGMGMTPQLGLSSAAKVELIARISAHGQALPHKGDLEGSIGPLDVHVRAPVDVVIDHVRAQ